MEFRTWGLAYTQLDFKQGWHLASTEPQAYPWTLQTGSQALSCWLLIEHQLCAPLLLFLGPGLHGHVFLLRSKPWGKEQVGTTSLINAKCLIVPVYFQWID